MHIRIDIFDWFYSLNANWLAERFMLNRRSFVFLSCFDFCQWIFKRTKISWHTNFTTQAIKIILFCFLYLNASFWSVKWNYQRLQQIFSFSIVPISCEIYMHFDCFGCFPVLVLLLPAIAASSIWLLDICIDFRATYWLFISAF